MMRLPTPLFLGSPDPELQALSSGLGQARVIANGVSLMHTLVAHDDPGFLVPLATALRCAGYIVTACDNGMSAWDDLNRNNINLLITQIQFPYPQPDGIALALKARGIQRDLRVVFMASTEHHPHPGGLGMCLTSPSVAQVMDAVVNAPS